MNRDRTSSAAPPVRAAPASRVLNRRRTTWYRLLVRIDAGTGSIDGLLPELLALPPDRVRTLLDARLDMPLDVQWRLAVIAECITPPNSVAARLARVLRGELKARAAYLQRGPIRDEPAPIRIYVERK